MKVSKAVRAEREAGKLSRDRAEEAYLAVLNRVQKERDMWRITAHELLDQVHANVSRVPGDTQKP